MMWVLLLIMVLGMVYLGSRIFGNFFNHVSVFSLVWFGGLVITLMNLSGLQTDWGVKEWSVFLIFGVCYVIGALAPLLWSKIPKVDTKNKGILQLPQLMLGKLYRVLLFTYILTFIVFTLEVIDYGGIPLISPAGFTAYADFGIKYIHYFISNLDTLFILSYVIIRTKQISKRKSIVLVVAMLISILIFIGIGHRLPLIVLALGCLIVEIVFLSKMSLRKLGLVVGVGLIIALVGFGYIGNIRTREGGSDYIRRTGQYKGVSQLICGASCSGENSFASVIDIIDNTNVIAWPYLYLVTSYENSLRQIYSVQNYTYGLRTLYPVWVFTFTKQLADPVIERATGDYSLVYKNFTASNAVGEFYADFGFWGLTIVPFLLGILLTVLYSHVVEKRDIIICVIYAISFMCTLYLCFTNLFSFPPFIFKLLYLIIFGYVIKMRSPMVQKLLNTKLAS